MASPKPKHPFRGPQAPKPIDRALALVGNTNLPVPDLALSGRCKMCRLADSDFDLFRVANIHLIGGGSQEMLLRYFRAHGHPEITANNISVHTKGHLSNWLGEALRYRMAAEALQNVLTDCDAADMAVAILKQIAIILGAIVADVYNDEAKP
ncbi:MAG TPA: hypothetical protein VM283_00400, partial [Armatimonadota bacterium]|nr:hypothetical protein [Armatimonadota bacterium]